jgi:hypothetical protein
VVFLSPSRNQPVLHLSQPKSAILKSDRIVKSTKEKKFMLMIMMMMTVMMMMMTVMIVIPFSSYFMLSTRSSWCSFIKLTSMEDVSHSHLLHHILLYGLRIHRNVVLRIIFWPKTAEGITGKAERRFCITTCITGTIFSPWLSSPQWVRASLLSRLYDHTKTHNSR